MTTDWWPFVRDLIVLFVTDNNRHGARLAAGVVAVEGLRY
jgi:hypothetical protein